MDRIRLLALVCSLGGLACKKNAPPPQAAQPVPAAEERAAQPTPSVPQAGPVPTTGKIENYRMALGLGTLPDGRQLVVLRNFERAGVGLALTVSPRDLKTQVLRKDALKIEAATWESLGAKLQGSAYLRALHDAAQHESVLQDAGITHVLPEEHGVVLTVDLCPSHKPLDDVLFKQVVNTFTPEEHPVPVAIAITGLWMEKHGKEFGRLNELVRSGKLDITWINHSYHHHYDPKLPMPKNFLLEKGTKMEDEILLNEAAMIEAGITPSAMFRFPGLVSDVEIVKTVISFGLVPIGSDAWLAKKEKAKTGDIVLVHGNGNEPAGINAFMQLLAQEKRDIKKHQFLLLDIREGLEEEEEKAP